MTFPNTHASGVLYGGVDGAAAQEQLSLNYVETVATAALCATVRERVDRQGIDILLQSQQPGHDMAFPQINAQLKCTHRPELVREDHVAWPLERAHYDKLRSKVQVPRILIVMHCPGDLTAWLAQDHQALTMSHAAYWVSLAGEPELPAGQDTKTVRVPRSQPFSVEQLLSMMDRAGKGVAL